MGAPALAAKIAKGYRRQRIAKGESMPADIEKKYPRTFKVRSMTSAEIGTVERGLQSLRETRASAAGPYCYQPAGKQEWFSAAVDRAPFRNVTLGLETKRHQRKA